MRRKPLTGFDPAAFQAELLAKYGPWWTEDLSEEERLRRRSARVAVKTAVRNGTLVRPDACSKCGTTERVIHAHHEDYAQPLSVEWLCSQCHGAHHSAIGHAVGHLRRKPAISSGE